MSRKSVKEYITLANLMTSFRIFGAAILVFIKPLSPIFYVLYTLCGLSDALDGTIARRTKTADEFGAKLDSIADLTFYWVIMLRILPPLLEALPSWIWKWVNIVIVIRVAAYGTAALKFHRFASLHTMLNKISSGGIFIIPYMLRTSVFTEYCAILCIITTAAGLEELILHLQASEYTPERKSLLTPRKK